MNRLLSAVLAAGVLIAPAAGLAQETPPSAPAAAPDAASAPAAAPAAPAEGGAPVEGPAAGEASNAGQGAPAAVDGSAAGEAGSEGEEHGAALHYPLEHPQELDWTFAGPFGHWDLGQLQRGLKVYKEVCSACHSMRLVSFRNLEALGYSEDQVRALAAEYEVQDGPDANGDMFDRAGIPSDRLPSPYENAEQAAASNGGAAPPDLSLIAKARSVERGFPTFVFDIFTQYAEGGPDYVHALLTGYGETPPSNIIVQDGTYYNPHFISGPALAMPAPLSDGVVTYDDGAPETLEQYSRDVSAFLMWTAEPHLVERKATGFVVLLFLVIFAGLIYAVKRRVWADTPH